MYKLVEEVRPRGLCIVWLSLLDRKAKFLRGDLRGEAGSEATLQPVELKTEGHILDPDSLLSTLRNDSWGRPRPTLNGMGARLGVGVRRALGTRRGDTGPSGLTV